MYNTTLSQKYVKDMRLCKKKIKDAYPKKVCHMLRHVKKKREKRKDSPLSKKKEKKRDAAYKRSSYTIHQKNIHTLAHLDQGL